MERSLLGYYHAIEESSRMMLDAAKAEDWDGVVRYEGNCAVLIEQLRYRARSEQLDLHSRVEKSRIMQRILRNDAQIRVLAEPMIDRFGRTVGGQHLLH